MRFSTTRGGWRTSGSTARSVCTRGSSCVCSSRTSSRYWLLLSSLLSSSALFSPPLSSSLHPLLLTLPSSLLALISPLLLLVCVCVYRWWTGWSTMGRCSSVNTQGWGSLCTAPAPCRRDTTTLRTWPRLVCLSVCLSVAKAAWGWYYGKGGRLRPLMGINLRWTESKERTEALSLSLSLSPSENDIVYILYVFLITFFLVYFCKWC